MAGNNSLPLYVELDVADIAQMVTREMARRYPEAVLRGFTVRSWNHDALAVRTDVHGRLVTDLPDGRKHVVDPARCFLPWSD